MGSQQPDPPDDARSDVDGAYVLDEDGSPRMSYGEDVSAVDRDAFDRIAATREDPRYC
jgi:hypothetical protein